MNKVEKAWWHTQSVVAVLFEKDILGMPELLLDSEGFTSNLKTRFAEGKEFAEYTSYHIENDHICFCLSKENFADVAAHSYGEYYVCGNFNEWDKAIGDASWKLKKTPHTQFHYEIQVPLALFGDRRKKFLFKFADANGRWIQPRSDAPNLEVDSSGNLNLRFSADKSSKNLIFAECAHPVDLREKTSIINVQTNERINVEVAQLLLELNYSDKMGVHLTDNSTTFTIFAPRAELVKVLVRNEINSPIKEYPLSTQDGALWKETFPENWEGKLYSYKIYGNNIDNSTAFDPKREIADPYAKALLKNSGPAKIVDVKKMRKACKNFTPPAWHDLVIMETHVRDLLANAPSGLISPQERLGFKGLAKWLRSGESYLAKVGVNCIELQPIQEFDNNNYADYHWGYMPVNWFAPSSAYANEPEKFSQTEDFADLVDAFHENNLAVILDVVYNHVGEPNHLLGIDKEYFFELSKDGHLMNFSGTGNDLRASAPMAKKLIIESLKHLVEVYNVDGFRFDLAELIGIDVLREIEFELKKIKPSIILIAEPWSFRGNIAAQLGFTGWAYWNDGFREFMLEYAANKGNFDGFKYYISGSQKWYAQWPAQTINYVESHDDMCLLDRISCNPKTPSVAEIKIYKLALALTLTSIGVPMIAEGADLLRTKNGVNNTYLRGDLNALDYERGAEYSGLRAWVRDFVKFRNSKAAAALKLQHGVGDSYCQFFPSKNSSAAAVMFNADKSKNAPRIFAIFNPADHIALFCVEGLDLRGFKFIADIDRFDIRGLNEQLSSQHGVASVPPRCFALFLEDA